MKEYYNLTETAALFKVDKWDIQKRCVKGDFDYLVDERGWYRITRESILRHLEELERKHNK